MQYSEYEKRAESVEKYTTAFEAIRNLRAFLAALDLLKGPLPGVHRKVEITISMEMEDDKFFQPAVTFVLEADTEPGDLAKEFATYLEAFSTRGIEVLSDELNAIE